MLFRSRVREADLDAGALARLVSALVLGIEKQKTGMNGSCDDTPSKPVQRVVFERCTGIDEDGLAALRAVVEVDIS